MKVPSQFASPLYLDYAASTPPDEEVVDSMLPWMREMHANPHSGHLHGQRAAAALQDAAATIADLIGADASEIVFTSGATEANNLALRGWLAGHPAQLAVSSIDHKSILEVARGLGRQGVHVTELKADHNGHVIVGYEALRNDAIERNLISVCHVNNELGTIQRIESLAERLDNTWRLHVDASQSAGKIPIDVGRANIALLSLSSHKMYGPAGIGALFVDANIRKQMSPLLLGGGQQDGLRPGTVPVFLAVGFATAVRLAQARMEQDAATLEVAAEKFLQRLRELDISSEIIGDPTYRLPGHLSIRIRGIDADDLLNTVSPRISVSAGAACESGELLVSHALRGIGLNERAAAEVIRISLGRGVTVEQAVAAAEALADGVNQVNTR